MSLTSGFFNSVNSDRLYDAEQMSAIFDGLINDGIYDSIGDGFETAPASGMTINVKTGRAWLNHTWIYNNSNYPLTLGAASASLNRIDTIAIKVDHSLAVRACSIVVVAGIPAASAVAPTLPADDTTNGVYYHRIADVSVTAGTTEITQAMITNHVGLSTGTPYVTGIISSTTLDQLWAQLEGEFMDWWDNTVKPVLNPEVVTNLQNQIDHITIKEATLNKYGLSHQNPPPSGKTYAPYSTDAVADKLYTDIGNVGTGIDNILMCTEYAFERLTIDDIDWSSAGAYASSLTKDAIINVISACEYNGTDYLLVFIHDTNAKDFVQLVLDRANNKLVYDAVVLQNASSITYINNACPWGLPNDVSNATSYIIKTASFSTIVVVRYGYYQSANNTLAHHGLWDPRNKHMFCNTPAGAIANAMIIDGDNAYQFYVTNTTSGTYKVVLRYNRYDLSTGTYYSAQDVDIGLTFSSSTWAAYTACITYARNGYLYILYSTQNGNSASNTRNYYIAKASISGSTITVIKNQLLCETKISAYPYYSYDKIVPVKNGEYLFIFYRYTTAASTFTYQYKVFTSDFAQHCEGTISDASNPLIYYLAGYGGGAAANKYSCEVFHVNRKYGLRVCFGSEMYLVAYSDNITYTDLINWNGVKVIDLQGATSYPIDYIESSDYMPILQDYPNFGDFVAKSLVIDLNTFKLTPIIDLYDPVLGARNSAIYHNSWQCYYTKIPNVLSKCIAVSSYKLYSATIPTDLFTKPCFDGDFVCKLTGKKLDL